MVQINPWIGKLKVSVGKDGRRKIKSQRELSVPEVVQWLKAHWRGDVNELLYNVSASTEDYEQVLDMIRESEENAK